MASDPAATFIEHRRTVDMVTLEKLTNDWRVAVGDDSGLGEHTITYDLRGDGFIHVTRDSVTNEDKPADLVVSAPLDVVNGVVRGTINPAVAMMKGKLKISPMSMAMKLQDALKVLATRMPEESDSASSYSLENEAAVDHPLPPPDGTMLLFEPDMLNTEETDSFSPLPGAPGILVRPLPAGEKHSEGKIVARVLRADPAQPYEAPSAQRQSPGIVTGYIINGWARYEVEGLGERRFDQGTFWSLPPRNRHRLTEISRDFESVEFELPHLTTFFRDGVLANTTEAEASNIDEQTPDSFKPIPNFEGSVLRYFTGLKEMTAGAANGLILKGNPPHAWVGSPWHLHHYDHFCGLVIKGSGNFEFEGIGSVDIEPGMFWYQQTRNRHRENAMSPDYQIIGIDIPAAYATTMFFFDEEAGEYRPMVMDDVAKEAGAVLESS
jgi:putative sterol carrier protein